MTHQWEEIDKQVAVATDYVECTTTQINKVLEPFTWLITTIDYVRHIRSQNKWCSVTDKCILFHYNITLTSLINFQHNKGWISKHRQSNGSHHRGIITIWRLRNLIFKENSELYTQHCCTLKMFWLYCIVFHQTTLFTALVRTGINSLSKFHYCSIHKL